MPSRIAYGANDLRLADNKRPRVTSLAGGGTAFSPLSLSPVGLWVSKGAASYAASKVNLGTGGATYNLSENNGPAAWDTATGSDCTNAKSFDTGIVIASHDWTVMLQYAGDDGSSHFLFGALDTASYACSINYSPQAGYQNGLVASAGIATTGAAGNVCIAGTVGAYYNGVLDTSGSLDGVGTPSSTLWLARANSTGQAGLNGFFIGALVCDYTLNATQVAQARAYFAAL